MVDRCVFQKIFDGFCALTWLTIILSKVKAHGHFWIVDDLIVDPARCNLHKGWQHMLHADLLSNHFFTIHTVHGTDY